MLVVDEDKSLTEKPCDYDLHPVYAGFLKRSSIKLRDLLLFMRYAPLYKGERSEWRSTMNALEKEDRSRAAGEAGRARKYGRCKAVAFQERLPKGCLRFLGIDVSSVKDLSPIANLACGLYIWYLARLQRDMSLDSESLEEVQGITSSREELTRLAIRLRDKEPAAEVLHVIGARSYQKDGSASFKGTTAAALRLLGDASIDPLKDVLRNCNHEPRCKISRLHYGLVVEDVDRSGLAQLGRMLSAIQTAAGIEAHKEA